MPVHNMHEKKLPGEGSPPGTEATRHSVNATGQRSYEFETMLDCPAEDVWRAVTEGAELSKWFAPMAEVTPGLGGKVWLSWGPGWEGAQRISVWEPGRRIGLNMWTDEPSDSAKASNSADASSASPEAVPVAVDFIIEGSGGQTMLRIVQSGFAPAKEWDGEVDSISRGWRIFTSQLKHYLERHRGKPAVNLWIERTVERLPISWRKLIAESSPIKFAKRGANGEVKVGTEFVAEAGGERFTGKVDFFGPSMEFGVILDDLNSGLLRFSAMNYGAWTGLSLYLVGYGDDLDRDQLLARATKFHEGVIEALGVGVEMPSVHPSYAAFRAAHDLSS